MGCCASRLRSSSSPYTSGGAIADQSSRNINNGSPAPSSIDDEPSAVPGQRPSSQSRRARAIPSSAHPNTPLKITSPSRRSHTPHKARWTRSRLDRERAEFWDTRTSGQGEVWATLRIVTERVQEGEIEQAQIYLDASGCTCPAGQLWKGCFDERGQFYQIPEWVVVLPEEIIEGSEGGVAAEGKGAMSLGGAAERPKEASPIRDKDSKVPLDISDAITTEAEAMIKVKIRLSSDARDITISIPSSFVGSQIQDHVIQEAKLPPEHTVRLMYFGKPLDVRKTLHELNWKPDDVVTAFVLPRV